MYFFLEDWQFVNEFRHIIGKVSTSPQYYYNKYKKQLKVEEKVGMAVKKAIKQEW